MVVLTGGRTVNRDRTLVAGFVGDDHEAVTRTNRGAADGRTQFKGEQFCEGGVECQVIRAAVVGQDIIIVGFEHGGRITERDFLLGDVTELQNVQGFVTLYCERRADRFDRTGRAGRVLDDAVAAAVRAEGAHQDVEGLTQGRRGEHGKVDRAEQNHARDEQPAHKRAQTGQAA